MALKDKERSVSASSVCDGFILHLVSLKGGTMTVLLRMIVEHLQLDAFAVDLY